MPGKVGRPRKNPLPDQVETIADVVEYPNQFESDMQQFFLEGNPHRLRRWFISNPENANKIAAFMVEWFRNKLAEML